MSFILKTLTLAAALLCLAACSTTKKTPYMSDDKEPGDLPPSARYIATRMALEDVLSQYSKAGDFYLCQSPAQVESLQRDLPFHRLHHASETYTAPVDDWPVAWSHRKSDDELATRVTIDIELAADTLTTTIYIGYQAPNLRTVHHTFTKMVTTWRLKKRDEEPEIKI